MGSSLKDLSSRQLERLKSELAEVIIANFCYPSFLDYRLNVPRTRPVDRRKRQEVWAYVNSVNMNALSSMDAASMEFRRFVERVFLRYIEMNRGLIGAISARQVTAVRARVPQLAVQVARGLIDYLTVSEASSFGRARPIESWAMLNAQRNELTWEQIERSTQVLQTTLVYLRTNKDTGPTAVVTGSGPQGRPPVHISDFPTRLLTPPPGFTYPPAQRTDEMVESNGGHAAVSNGAAYTAGNGHAPAQPAAQEDPQRKIQGPNRSPTASRPLDRPLSLPSLNPAVLNSMSDAAPGVPPPSRILSRPIAPQPQPPGQPAAPPQPAAPMPAQVQPSSVPPTQQPPVQKPPEPVAPLVSPTDAWQELLWKGNDEQQSPPSEVKAGPIPPAALPPEAAPKATPKTEQVFPIEELPELPESFEVASALDLPPDLEELYGDYLRDARSGHLDLTPSPAETPNAAEPLKGPQSSPALEAETEEEVDALFDALASHLAELSETTEPSAQQKAGQASSPVEPGEPQQRIASSPLNTKQASDASMLFREAQQQPLSQGEEAAPASVPQAADERPPRVRSSGPIGPAAQPPANRPPVPPAATSKPITVSSGPLGRMLTSSDLKPLTTSGALMEGDVMIFAQLQHQVGTWVKMAAVSHQIDLAGRDALELIAELRRMAALEEAELQVVESLVTLCQRVVRSKQATVDDYKQAMMLYLLHHRSRLAL
jgi:hypothetical protein